VDQVHEETIKENEIKHTDNRTIAEMWSDDKDIMSKESLTNFKFDSKEKAAFFHIACIPAAVGKLGVPDPANIPKIAVEAVFDQHNIKFEKRNDPEEGWRCGVYIYKNNELAYFVSAIIDSTPNSRVITHGRYRVVTNVMRA